MADEHRRESRTENMFQQVPHYNCFSKFPTETGLVLLFTLEWINFKIYMESLKSHPLT